MLFARWLKMLHHKKTIDNVPIEIKAVSIAKRGLVNTLGFTQDQEITRHEPIA
jgi:hypothetical protein